MVANMLLDGFGASTVSTYTSNLKRFISPAVGKMPVDQLTVPMIYSLILDDVTSHTARCGIQRTLTAVLDEAVLLGAISASPLARPIVRRPPRRHRAKPAVEATAIPQPETIKRILDAAEPEILSDIIRIQAFCGLRLGEVLALRQQSIDTAAKVIRVDSTIDRKNHIGPAKTASSVRRVPYPEAMEPRLVQLRDGQQQHHKVLRRRLGDYRKPSDLLFHTRYFSPLWPTQVRRRWWHPLLQRLDLPPMRMHVLRHFAASSWNQAGIPIQAISEWLGHSSTSVTMGVYVHLFDAARDEAAGRALMSAGAAALLGDDDED